MPAVRFSRDKRGYEYTYLVHTPMRRGKPGRTRVLYWYRTPPGVRVGRPPFDPDVQRLIEAQNPGITFDWDTIINTPFPPPDMTEFWRERRRAEKAARQERRSQEADASVPSAPELTGPEDAAPLPEPQIEPLSAEANGAAADVPEESSPEGAATDGAGPKKRRRRRGGRRRRSGVEDGSALSSDAAEPGTPAEELGAAGAGETDQSETTDPASEEP